MRVETTTVLDSSKEPNGFGEWLRSRFFDSDGHNDPKGLGCYTTMEWGADVKDLGGFTDGQYEDRWHVGSWNGYTCFWMWDGDGTLVFALPDGTWIYNDDCKKTYGWKPAYPNLKRLLKRKLLTPKKEEK